MGYKRIVSVGLAVGGPWVDQNALCMLQMWPKQPQLAATYQTVRDGEVLRVDEGECVEEAGRAVGDVMDPVKAARRHQEHVCGHGRGGAAAAGGKGREKEEDKG